MFVWWWGPIFSIISIFYVLPSTFHLLSHAFYLLSSIFYFNSIYVLSSIFYLLSSIVNLLSSIFYFPSSNPKPNLSLFRKPPALLHMFASTASFGRPGCRRGAGGPRRLLDIGLRPLCHPPPIRRPRHGAGIIGYHGSTPPEWRGSWKQWPLYT